MRMNKITRVLISVTDKAGIVEFARGLADFNVEIKIRAENIFA